jgi:hypothetical protein
MSPILRRWLLGAALACVGGWAAGAPKRAVPRQIAASSPVAFVNVNVVPMDADRVLERHTVIVRDGRIAELGPADSIAVPADAERLEGEGRYLMPGLADMHTHFGSDDTDWEKDLFLFLANGVTTVREMWGQVRLRWREAIASGAVLGPRLYVASPGMDGAGGHWSSVTPPVTTPEQARRTVAYYRALGYDFIKVYTDLTQEVYEAILEEARAQGIRVVGHVPRRVGLANVLAAGQSSLEHLWNYPEQAFSNGSPYSGVLDETRLRAVAAQIGDAGAWVTPTLAVGLVPLSQVPVLRERPEMRYVSPAFKRWFDHPLQHFGTNSDLTLFEANTKAVVKVLEDSGVKLLLGVDSGFRYLLPGFSIHDELRLRVEAGLSPYQVLRMGTVNVAEFLASDEHAGTVAVGKRADLLLLEANPLEDVRNVGRRAGVMVGGRWMSEEWLQQRLEEIARVYGN